MREIRTSGSMSGEGKRGGALREYPRPSSTLPCHPSGMAFRIGWIVRGQPGAHPEGMRAY